MKQVVWIMGALMALLFVFGVGSALAQDGAVTDTEVIGLTWQGLAALVSIVLAVGLGGGIGGALLIVRAARQDEALKYAMERLYMSAPPDTQERIRRIVELLVEGGELADEVTDGVVE